MGAEPDQWQKLVEVAQEGVRLWQVPRDRAETVDFIYGLRRSKGTHQKTWFLIDERQTIFKTGIINSALQKNDKAQHARQVQEFFDRAIQLFSLTRSEERRAGNECVSTCRSRWSAYHSKNKTKKKHQDKQ